MRYSRLGGSGLVVSRIGLGMMSYGDTNRRPWHLDAEWMLSTTSCARARRAISRVEHVRLALDWAITQNGVAAPLVGATKFAHITDAIAAAELELDSTEHARLEAPYRLHPVLGHE